MPMESRSEGLVLDDIAPDVAIGRSAAGNWGNDRVPSVERAKPFVKWAGGKRSVVEELVARFPATFESYWEPFVGGGALFFRIHDEVEEAHLSDSNLELMIAFEVVRSSPAELTAGLERHARRHCKEYYYRVRGRHGLKDPVELAARLIYLNKTCYNGLYRVNGKGKFNVPIGSYENPNIVVEGNVYLCSSALQRASIKWREFDAIEPSFGDLVYFDPPYHPVNSTSFTKYTKLAFGDRDQKRLRDFALELHSQGVHVMLSNSDTPLVRELYRDEMWSIDSIRVPRNVNSKGDGRGAVDELVITNYVP